MNRALVKGSRYFPLLFILISALTVDPTPVAGVTPNQVATRETAPPERILKFFYLVNESERNVKLRVLVDNKQVLVQEIGSKTEGQAAAEQAPPPARHPARELKVPIARSAKRITVEELKSGLKKRFKLADVVKVDGGFRIEIQKKTILFAQDYFPAR